MSIKTDKSRFHFQVTCKPVILTFCDMGRRLMICVLLMTLTGCGTTDEGQVNMGDIEPGVLKGRVVDAAGSPIEGAEVVADNQLLYNSNAVIRTDSDGFYRLDTDVRATFHATASVTKQYNGQDYTLSLAPDDDATFAGPTGAIRNFTWKLSGKKPDDLGFYGGKVLFNFGITDTLDTFLEDEKVQLTLTPEGPLIDGSEGSPIVGMATRNGDGSGLEDVPIGRYRITADYEGRPLAVKLRKGGDYARDVVADFAPIMTGIYFIELELALPRA
ncbi:carboxypeptidase-like regulatory domain-containing protein [Nonomuraea wenchangensis]